MEQMKICPLMGGNYCQRDRCGLWAFGGNMCAVTQIGSSLAGINSYGLKVDAGETENILRTISHDISAIERTI